MYQDDLAKLTKDELVALVGAQAAQIAELTRRVAELEAKLGQPPKTPDNSSVPPSQARKPNRAERRAAKTKWGAHTYAAAASVIATGRLHGHSALQALQAALVGRPVLMPP